MTEWTRADLPSEGELADLIRDALDGGIYEGKMLLPGHRLRAIIDLLARWLNAHYPKPEPDRWRRAHAIVEQERDQARKSLEDERIVNESMTTSLFEVSRQRDYAVIERDAAVARAEQAENARDTAATRAEQLEKRLAKVMSDYQDVEDERDEWKARAEEAERAAGHLRKILNTQQGRVADAEKGHPAPAVSRADIEKAIGSRHVVRRFLDDVTMVSVSDAADAVCDLFGVEAEQAVDPVEAKARELWETGRGPSVHIEFDDIAPDHRGEYLRIARHQLGQEATR